MGGNNEFFGNFERNKYLKKLPSMQRVNYTSFHALQLVRYQTKFKTNISKQNWCGQ